MLPRAMLKSPGPGSPRGSDRNIRDWLPGQAGAARSLGCLDEDRRPAQAGCADRRVLRLVHGRNQFGKKQHSIVQRLLRALRKSAAQRSLAETAAEGYENVAQPPRAVDGSGYAGPDPPTAPLPVPVLNVGPSANVLRQPAW
jgi:hypothetical protein